MTPTGTDPRAWRADTLDDPAAWSCPLSEPALAALEPALLTSLLS